MINSIKHICIILNRQSKHLFYAYAHSLDNHYFLNLICAYVQKIIQKMYFKHLFSMI